MKFFERVQSAYQRLVGSPSAPYEEVSRRELGHNEFIELLRELKTDPPSSGVDVTIERDMGAFPLLRDGRRFYGVSPDNLFLGEKAPLRRMHLTPHNAIHLDYAATEMISSDGDNERHKVDLRVIERCIPRNVEQARATLEYTL